MKKYNAKKKRGEVLATPPLALRATLFFAVCGLRASGTKYCLGDSFALSGFPRSSGDWAVCFLPLQFVTERHRQRETFIPSIDSWELWELSSVAVNCSQIRVRILPSPKSL